MAVAVRSTNLRFGSWQSWFGGEVKGGRAPALGLVVFVEAGVGASMTRRAFRRRRGP